MHRGGYVPTGEPSEPRFPQVAYEALDSQSWPILGMLLRYVFNLPAHKLGLLLPVPSCVHALTSEEMA